MQRRHVSLAVMLLAVPAQAQFSFLPAQTFAVGAGSSGPHSLAHGDFDGDGDVDLAVACLNSSTVRLFQNLTVGSSVSFTLAQTLNAAVLPRGIAVGDFDSDGDLDLVVVRTNDAPSVAGAVDFFRNDSSTGGNIAFVNGGSITLPAPPAGTTQTGLAIAAADFNMNGFMDFVVTEERIQASTQVNGRAHVFLGNGAGGFSLIVSLTVRKQPMSVAVGRFDGGNVPDIAVACAGSDTIVVYLGIGPGAFMATTLPNGSPMRTDCQGTDFPVKLAAARLDEGDTHDDLVCANLLSDTGYVFGGRDDGFFNDMGCVSMVGADVLDGLVAGDFDRDGETDFAVSLASNSVGVLRKHSDAFAFEAPQVLAVGNTPLGLDAFDVDGNGCLDILAANFGGDSISVTLNTCP